MKAALGMTAGAVGSFIGTPAEISLIRMTADGRYSGATCVPLLTPVVGSFNKMLLHTWLYTAILFNRIFINEDFL